MILLLTTLCVAATRGAFAETVEPNPIDSGECLNKSQDKADCNHSVLSDKITDSVRASRYDGQLSDDDQKRLQHRLEQIDRLDSKEESELESNNVREADSTLRQVLFIHRHGDRTPIVFPPKDNLATEPFWTFHGLGQLTNRGKSRLYLLGKIIRKRYNKFLGSSVNKNERVTRASGSLRCIESAQTFLAGFLRLDLPDSPDARELIWDRDPVDNLAHLWQPASVQTVPAKFDGMLAEGAECSVLTDEYLNVIDKSDEVKTINTEYAKERDLLIQSLGFEMDHFYKWFWASSVIEVEKSYFPEKVKPELLRSFDRIDEASNKSLGLYQSTLKSKRLRHGLLINEMVNLMKTARDGGNNNNKQVIKFAHYAGHDLTLVVILGMLDVWKEFPRRPNYASNIATELHQDGDEWFVRFLYMEQVPSIPFELHVKRCEEDHPLKRCTLDKFADLMKPYMIDSWQNWMSECGNDLTKLNPYATGS